MSKNNRSNPRIETSAIWRNGKRGRTVQLTQLGPMFGYVTESAESYERLSTGLSEDEAAAAALERRIRYLVNMAFTYLAQLSAQDKRKALAILDDLTASLQFSEDGKAIQIRSI